MITRAKKLFSSAYRIDPPGWGNIFRLYFDYEGQSHFKESMSHCDKMWLSTALLY